jgi:glycosyltransferase involved in cell wall biosynthesis
MESRRKLFTIALPVRNGGEHLKLCVASILAQTIDFDLAILENGSTDGTAQWLAALRDPRVRLYPAERPLSIEENWARIKDIPKNEFVTTIGHDDLLDPGFLERIAALIRAHPGAGLYSTHFRIIDAGGAFLRHCRPIPSRETAAEFVAARLADLRDSFGTGNVLRSATYDAVGGIPPFPKLLYADDALFVQAIGSSYRATALEEGFSYRWHTTNASATCARDDLFRGLEQYGRLLLELRARDPALAEVLRRYFPAYAAIEGRRWRQDALLAAYHAHSVLDEAVEKRALALASLFGETPGAPEVPRPFNERLLEYATRSALGRVLYAGWRIQKNCRTAARRVLGGA